MRHLLAEGLGGPSLSRRSLLASALAASIVAGCGTAKPGPSVSVLGPTVESLLADTPFYVAHRGGGGNWPEMTGFAYEQAAQLPNLRAVEISVCLSADGVLVCSHDPTTLRVTDVDYTIAEQTWTTLSTLLVKADTTDDPTQPPRPLTRLDDVLAAHPDRFVLFVEPKVVPAAQPLMTRLTSLGHPDRVVWKQYVNSPMFKAAKELGFSTWGYILDEPAHRGANLQRFAASPDIDMLGVHVSDSDEFVQKVLGLGAAHDKPVIMWPITSPIERERALRLGCRGLMTSRIKEALAF